MTDTSSRYESFVRAAPSWMVEPGPAREVILASRVRLARNLGSLPFPGGRTVFESLPGEEPQVLCVGVGECCYPFEER